MNTTTVKFYIAEVDLIPNRELFCPILARRNEHGFLVYDLEPIVKHVYTNIDIELALSHGYVLQNIYSIITWNHSKQWFKDYIDKTFALKKASEKDTANYEVSKLMSNSVYGKMLQKLIISHMKIINSTSDTAMNEIDEIRTTSNIKEYIPLSDARMMVTYETSDPNELDQTVKKPSYLGAFILSYSRLWMSQFLDSTGGWYKPKYSFFRTDTDSLIMHSRCLPYLQKFIGKELGDLDLDIKGKIVKYAEPFPKVYCCYYVPEKDIPKKDIDGNEIIVWKKNHIAQHTRAKGFVRDAAVKLKMHHFEALLNVGDSLNEKIIESSFDYIDNFKNLKRAGAGIDKLTLENIFTKNDNYIKLCESELPVEIKDQFNNVNGNVTLSGGLCSYEMLKFRKNAFSKRLVSENRFCSIDLITQSRTLGKHSWVKREHIGNDQYTSIPHNYKFNTFIQKSAEPYDLDLFFSLDSKNIEFFTS